MALDWSSKVIKYALFVFNLAFVISGIILIAIGVSVKTFYSQYDTILDDKYFSLPNLLIATGSLIFFISFFGCCGALRESWILLYGFVGLLILIFIFEFSAGIAGYVLRDRTRDFLSEKLMDNLMKYEEHGSYQVAAMWDGIQSEFKCCGVNSPQDWKNRFPNGSLPTSCCKNPVGSIGITNCALMDDDLKAVSRRKRDDTGANPDNNTTSSSSGNTIATDASTNITIKEDPTTTSTTTTTTTTTTTPPPVIYNGTYYNIGCVDGFGKFIKSQAVTLGGCGLAIAFIQLLGIIFACHLSRRIRQGYFAT